MAAPIAADRLGRAFVEGHLAQQLERAGVRGIKIEDPQPAQLAGMPAEQRGFYGPLMETLLAYGAERSEGIVQGLYESMRPSEKRMLREELAAMISEVSRRWRDVPP